MSERAQIPRDRIISEARDPLPRSLREKFAKREELRRRRYGGDKYVSEADVSEAVIEDIDHAIQFQLDRRRTIMTVVAAIAGVVSLMDFVVRIVTRR